jgi:hypothetical protein
LLVEDQDVHVADTEMRDEHVFACEQHLRREASLDDERSRINLCRHGDEGEQLTERGIAAPG